MELINKARKEELLKMGFGELQSTEEYKYFIKNYITSQSRLMNEEINYILKRSYEDDDTPFSYDDITNLYIYSYDAEEEAKHKYSDDEAWKNLSFNQKQDTINTLCPDAETEQQEIYQWFIMDERIINQLEERGEPTLNGVYWGRTCCGQAIEMDGVIIQIFKEWFLELYGVCEK
jgi:capsule polysaccharide export protein KpsE/RkpR